MAELVEPQVSRYPAYKLTGVEWLPEIPAGWEVKKLKHCFKFSVGGTPTTSKQSYFEGENTWVTIADMQQRVITESKTSLSDDALVAASMEVVPEGSLLYSFKLSVGKVAFAGKNLYTNEAIFSVLPTPAYDLTYFYFALPELLIHSAGQNIYGAKIFNQELLKNAFIALPPLAEQRAITRFLDDKTAQLDQLITQKRQMLELLREERAALINHAVTKGLDATAPLRDSGVEWLGEVPAHWEVVKLTTYLESIIDYRGRTPNKIPEGVFLVTARNVKKGQIDYSLSEEYVSEEEREKFMQRGAVEIGDVLFTMEAPLGEAANVDRTDICLAQRLVKFRGKPNKLNNYFLRHWIGSHVFQNDLQSFATGSTVLGIKSSKLNQLTQLVPPLSEQIGIVEFIERTSAKVTITTATINQEIALLQEYRAALIAEAVTGQLDVRDYAPAAAVLM